MASTAQRSKEIAEWNAKLQSDAESIRKRVTSAIADLLERDFRRLQSYSLESKENRATIHFKVDLDIGPRHTQHKKFPVSIAMSVSPPVHALERQA